MEQKPINLEPIIISDFTFQILDLPLSRSGKVKLQSESGIINLKS